MTSEAPQRSEQRSWIMPVAIAMLVCICIGCDQGTKLVARDQLAPKQWVEVVPSVFSLTNVENTGAFLGLGSELGAWRAPLMVWLPGAVLFGLLGYIILGKQLPSNQRLIMALIVGGGFGNLIDRIRYGSVTDFLHLDFGLFRTGIFNVADLLITTGMVVLLFMSFKAKK